MLKSFSILDISHLENNFEILMYIISYFTFSDFLNIFSKLIYKMLRI